MLMSAAPAIVWGSWPAGLDKGSCVGDPVFPWERFRLLAIVPEGEVRWLLPEATLEERKLPVVVAWAGAGAIRVLAFAAELTRAVWLPEGALTWVIAEPVPVEDRVPAFAEVVAPVVVVAAPVAEGATRVVEDAAPVVGAARGVVGSVAKESLLSVEVDLSL